VLGTTTIDRRDRPTARPLGYFAAMPFVSILAEPGHDHLHIRGSADPIAIPQPLTPDGIFTDRPELVVFEREVPDPALLLTRLEAVLSSSRVGSEPDAFDCPVPLAIRAIEIAAAELWPVNQLRCPDCQYYFEAPFTESHRMYVSCPNCSNLMLNPRWNSA
jgi:hypothetical protein